MSEKTVIIDPNHAPLSKEETEAAANELLIDYPCVIRSNVDPAIPHHPEQRVANVSFLLFKEPKQTKYGKPVYGMFNVRGVWPTVEEARKDGTRIIRDVDSRNRVIHTRVGTWGMITDDSAAIADITDVHEEDDVVRLRDETAKESQAERRREIKERKEKQEQLHYEMQQEAKEKEYKRKKELASRTADLQNELAEGKDIYSDKEKLDYYIMKMEVSRTLKEKIASLRKEIESFTGTQKQVWRLLKEIEQRNPTHRDQWLDRFNEKRAEVGLPQFIPSSTFYDDMDSVTLEQLIEEGVELPKLG